VPAALATTLRPVASAAQLVLLTLAPHGGQLRARRNAWAAMGDDARRARARREAGVALADAALAAAASTGSTAAVAAQQ
jgi:hypothetical protein